MKEKAERKYAAYTKKNALTMYRSINEVPSKKRSMPSNQTESLLARDESRTVFAANADGSIIEIPDSGADDYRRDEDDKDTFDYNEQSMEG